VGLKEALMATVVSMRAHRPVPIPEERTRPRPWWVWLSVPVAALGAAGSVAGILVGSVYEHETKNWAAQAVGQDIANLVVFGAMLVLGYAAGRGSLRAHLAWLGTLAYTVYTYAIYAFAVHFGPLFLVYVAVFGLSVWAFISGLAILEPRHLRAAFTGAPGAGYVSLFLMVVAGAFALMWLAQDLPAMLDNRSSQELRDTGLLTNPVHVLDLALFLPAAALAGVLLRRRAAWGYLLAPVVLTAMAAISGGIVAVVVVSVARDLGGSLVVAAVIGVLGVVQAVACWHLLAGLDPDASTTDVLRRYAGPR
jgi:hypothetical protein